MNIAALFYQYIDIVDNDDSSMITSTKIAQMAMLSQKMGCQSSR